MKTLKKLALFSFANLFALGIVMADPGTGNDSKNKSNETAVMTQKKSNSPIANNYKLNKNIKANRELAAPVVSSPTSNNFKDNNYKLNKNKSVNTEEGNSIVTQKEEQSSFPVFKGHKHAKSSGKTQ
ncbi:hypothetical protein [Flexithrix dorotheae]|uniref:hypothetical protein n=1 Tax=Flexithrix dorotheae TaxID=70993 RepID=UPI0003800859|nr:hypothetical protein [Flexithrix dorotheae]